MTGAKEKQQPGKKGGIRLGLCCIFKEEPIRFKATTAKYLLQFSRSEQLQKLSVLCLHNSESLLVALRFLQQNGIGAFRILSPLFPRFTDPEVGYTLLDLPDAEEILENISCIKCPLVPIPTTALGLSMSAAIVETLPKRSWRTSPASNVQLFPHLQQLWGVMARTLPFATWVV